uniref:Secreted protein n=1 Tax=Parascaris univalens TaxID=6257 RepID=A0A915A7N8_PARUN
MGVLDVVKCLRSTSSFLTSAHCVLSSMYSVPEFIARFRQSRANFGAVCCHSNWQWCTLKDDKCTPSCYHTTEGKIYFCLEDLILLGSSL